MSLTGFTSPSKAKYRLRPNVIESQHIKYMLAIRGYSLIEIGNKLEMTRMAITRVLRGQSRSVRIEAEIARLLGKPSWNDVVSEARLATRDFVDPTTPSRPRGKRRSA